MRSCPKCGAENPDIAKFCNQCGVSLVTAFDSASATIAANPGSYFEYTEWDSEITITKLKNKEMEGKIVIPAQIDGLPVTCIGNREGGDGSIYGAFEDCSGLTSVTIPESVKYVSHSAFAGCSSLTSVTILEGVTSIVDRAFGYCKNLTIQTPENSTAETYAKKNKIPYVSED